MAGGDSYRPTRRRPPPSDGGAPPTAPSGSLASRITFTHGGGDSHAGDSYRPAQAPGGHSNYPQPGFSFSAGQRGPQFPPVNPADTQNGRKVLRPRRGNGNSNNTNTNQRGPARPTGPHHRDQQQQQGRQHWGPANANPNGSGNGNWGGPRRYNTRPPKPMAHERELLQSRGDDTEIRFGATDGVNKFLDVDDLSSSEGEMDLRGSGCDGSNDSADDGRRKVARVTTARDDGDSVPQWSNPDPYFGLPATTEIVKKKDVVQLIRKAKNQTADKAIGDNPLAANDDFISFGDDDGEQVEEELIKPMIPPPPTSLPPTPPGLPPPPPPPDFDYPSLTGSLNDLPARPGAKRPADTVPDPRLRSRPTKRKRGQHAGAIVSEWLSMPGVDPVPWCRNQNYGNSISQKNASDYEKMLMLLHNEIYDFYEYVEPTAHDYQVRMNLIGRIEQAIGGRHVVLADHSKIKCFGSFPPSLYLPTADMDLVLVSDMYQRTGNPVQLSHNGKHLYTAAKRLQNARIVDGHPTVIKKAKVPIIKFVDRETGIKVDLSFENLSGIPAQDSFKKWTTDFPVMFPMVALVKQFLIMRGLSDVHTGGLGGFSIICLIYAHIRLVQQKLGPNEPMPNLAKLFMGFLDFWGNDFNLASQRLAMSDPPTVVPKQRIGIDGRDEKVDGLSIQDPHNPMNNISGGSAKVKIIFQYFAEAHEVLEERLEVLDLSGTSILGSILGGNYAAYDDHKRHMKTLAHGKDETETEADSDGDRYYDSDSNMLDYSYSHRRDMDSDMDSDYEI